MPSVASEVSVSQSIRLQPIARGPFGPGRQEAATPFAMLLDTTAPSPEPPPRSERAEARTERRDDAPPADDRPAEASTPARDAKDSGKASDDTTEDSKDTKAAAKDGSATDTDTDAKEAATLATDDAAAEIVAIANPAAQSTEAATAAALPAAPVAVNGPVQTEAAPDAELAAALAAVQAPGTAAEAKPELKPEAKTDAKADAKSADKPATAQGSTQAGTLMVETDLESGKNDNASGNGEHTAKQQHGAETRTQAPGLEPAARVADAPAAVKAASEVVQNLGVQVTPTHTTGPVQAAASAAQPAAVPVSGLAVEIVAQAHAGKNRFEIRLDPPELGRIDVRLDVDRDGNVTSRLVVDRVETLDLLRRESSQLERALQQAGLKTSDSALEFSLRGHAFGRDQSAPEQQGSRLVVADENAAPIEALRQGYGRHLGLGRGIDIRV